MPNDGAQRGIDRVEYEKHALDKILMCVDDNPTELNINVLHKIGDMRARLVNRGKPAGYVVTSEGTFMVTVEIVSRAVMASE